MRESGVRTVAAVDLGSNSFHMVVVRVSGNEVNVVDKLKERVALAAGLDEHRRLEDDAWDRAIACLARFGERLRPLPEVSVRAVGTNTLRKLRQPRRFLEAAHRALGHPIEIISGAEEARLIYVGVAHGLQGVDGRRLVVDIGGGSTECVVGEGYEPVELHSLYMGHLDFTHRFFSDGKIKKKHYEEAKLAAASELRAIERPFRELGWNQAIGCSGTIEDIETILRTNGWSSAGILADGLATLEQKVLSTKRVEKLDIDGLDDDRAPNLPAGLAILRAVFERLGIEHMIVSSSALREGVVYDMVGRFLDHDMRERTVEVLVERYRVDRAQAARVERVACDLLAQVAEDWELTDPGWERRLRWAARLHEIGLSMAYSGYHKHGHYILANSDMPGFSHDAQNEVATLVLAHRRKLRPSRFEQLPADRTEADLRLCVLLRLAVRLCRHRNDDGIPRVRLEAPDKNTLRVLFESGALEDNPLTRVDLEDEKKRLESGDIELQVDEQE